MKHLNDNWEGFLDKARADYFASLPKVSVLSEANFDDFKRKGTYVMGYDERKKLYIVPHTSRLKKYITQYIEDIGIFRLLIHNQWPHQINNIMNNKTYILLKDTPEAKAGTEFVYSTDYNSGFDIEPVYINKEVECCYRPDVVENQSKWFKLKEEKVWTDSDMMEFAIHWESTSGNIKQELSRWRDYVMKAKMFGRVDKMTR